MVNRSLQHFMPAISTEVDEGVVVVFEFGETVLIPSNAIAAIGALRIHWSANKFEIWRYVDPGFNLPPDRDFRIVRYEYGPSSGPKTEQEFQSELPNRAPRGNKVGLAKPCSEVVHSGPTTAGRTFLVLEEDSAGNKLIRGAFDIRKIRGDRWVESVRTTVDVDFPFKHNLFFKMVTAGDLSGTTVASLALLAVLDVADVDAFLESLLVAKSMGDPTIAARASVELT